MNSITHGRNTLTLKDQMKQSTEEELEWKNELKLLLGESRHLLVNFAETLRLL